MRDISIPETGPKRKILDAAEQLFADKGFDAVSVRDITKQAGANVAAVNYHFGSRDGLVTLVMLRYLKPVNEERASLLDAAERKAGNKPIPLEELIEALVRPLANQVSKSELSERLFCKLLGRVMAEQENSVPTALESQMRPVVTRFHRAFFKTLPALEPEVVVWRCHFLAGGMIHMLTHQEMFRRLAPHVGNPTIEETVKRFVIYAAAGMRAGIDEGTAKYSENKTTPELFNL